MHFFLIDLKHPALTLTHVRRGKMSAHVSIRLTMSLQRRRLLGQPKQEFDGILPQSDPAMRCCLRQLDSTRYRQLEDRRVEKLVLIGDSLSFSLPVS